MNPITNPGPEASLTDQRVLDLVRAELTSKRRWVHRVGLVGALIMLAVILSLWTTEPGPLPMRLHGAFGLMSAIAVGWIAIIGNILWRKNCPTARDQIATATMSVVGSLTFTVAAVVITSLRGDIAALATLAALGMSLTLLASLHLRFSLRWRGELQRRLAGDN